MPRGAAALSARIACAAHAAAAGALAALAAALAALLAARGASCAAPIHAVAALATAAAHPAQFVPCHRRGVHRLQVLQPPWLRLHAQPALAALPVPVPVGGDLRRL